jgi:hypothetical protein
MAQTAGSRVPRFRPKDLYGANGVKAVVTGPHRRFAVKHPSWEPYAGCDRKAGMSLPSESLVRSKPSRRDGSESCGRRGDAGSEA